MGYVDNEPGLLLSPRDPGAGGEGICLRSRCRPHLRQAGCDSANPKRDGEEGRVTNHWSNAPLYPFQTLGHFGFARHQRRQSAPVE
jgi:hypothetical protein